ncbi:hypothetical protein FOZ63_024077 [Perkinsus olseni]|uniref:Uncharacterized protein n=1 Tax=Perkinsus olseni TaxID=32597 RepID=A0A7J6U1W9_PEROL|nr:hypothetical protein FOZ62_022909 [Perkinsus olseni]KAF4754419.1 hypothetical protein FOZ63_024077 [Perkinsus olseni]
MTFPLLLALLLISSATRPKPSPGHYEMARSGVEYGLQKIRNIEMDISNFGDNLFNLTFLGDEKTERITGRLSSSNSPAHKSTIFPASLKSRCWGVDYRNGKAAEFRRMQRSFGVDLVEVSLSTTLICVEGEDTIDLRWRRMGALQDFYLIQLQKIPSSRKRKAKEGAGRRKQARPMKLTRLL